jgi:hypothetical protein
MFQARLFRILLGNPKSPPAAARGAAKRGDDAMTAYAAERWQHAEGVFTPLELQVIALAAGSPGDCRVSTTDGGLLARIGRALAKLFALHIPAGLANERLEALRRLACRSFATGGRLEQETIAKALAAGLNRLQVDTVAGIAAGWHANLTR